MNARLRDCAHEGCGCTTPSDSGYCSSYCDNVQVHETDPSACACGHEDCKASQRVAPEPPHESTSIGRGPGGVEGDGS